MKKDIAFFNALNRKVVFVNYQNPLAAFLTKAYGNKKEFLMSDIRKRLGTKRIKENLIDSLVTREILIEDNVDEKKKIEMLRKKFLGHPAINVLYLILTDKCNFRCKYCFFEGGFSEDAIFSDMNKEIAKRSIDLYQKSLENALKKGLVEPKDANVILYGGEPLLNMETMRFVVKYIAKLKEKNLLPKELSININTNGSLLTKDICRFLKKYRIENDISIDGPAEIHDQCRFYCEGKGTFRDVIRGFYLSKKEGVKTCISCTIGEHNIGKLSEVFKWFIDELKPNAVGFNPPLWNPQIEIDSSYNEKVSKALIECFDIARKRGMYEARMMRKVRAFIEGYTYPFDCCAHGKQLVISPSGKIGTCHAYCGSGKFFTEFNKKFDPYDHQYWKKWSSVSPLNNEKCQNCEAISICGGGCSYNAEMKYGDISAIDPSFCMHAKDTLKWLIEDLYEKTISI